MTDKQVVMAVRRMRSHLHAADGYRANGIHYRAIDKDLNALEKAHIHKPLWMNIGPIWPGGPSLLDMSLTHLTTGLEMFPAIDGAWGAGGGVPLYAPELLVVDTKDSHANPGEAFYATGASKIRYWVGHLTKDWPLGTRLAKGTVIGHTIDQAGTDHGHVGVNVEALMGKGKRLKYGRTGNGPNYTVGSPTIRNQLLALEV